MLVWIILAAVAAVIALLLLLPIRMSFRLRYNEEADGRLTITYGPIKKKKKNIPDDSAAADDAEKKEETEKQEKDQTRAGKKKISPGEIVGFAKRNLVDIKKLIGAVLKFILTRSIKINKLKLRLVIGVDDAMNTAMLYGGACALIFNSVALIDRHMRLERHSINVKPAFNEPHIFAEVETVVSTCIGNILAIAAIAVWYGLPIAWKFRKEILKNGKSD